MVLRRTSLTQHRPQAFDRVRGCRHDLSETPTAVPCEERQVQPLAPVRVANLRMTESLNAVERARLVDHVPRELGRPVSWKPADLPALVPSPKRSAAPRSDINAVVGDSQSEVLDPKRPIREADPLGQRSARPGRPKAEAKSLSWG
jgi:hypothetical protein